VISLRHRRFLDNLFKELNDRANSLANALSGIGVKKGDRVAVLLDTCPQYVELYCAGAKSGMIITPLKRLSEN